MPKDRKVRWMRWDGNYETGPGYNAPNSLGLNKRDPDSFDAPAYSEKDPPSDVAGFTASFGNVGRSYEYPKEMFIQPDVPLLSGSKLPLKSYEGTGKEKDEEITTIYASTGEANGPE